MVVCRQACTGLLGRQAHARVMHRVVRRSGTCKVGVACRLVQARVMGTFTPSVKYKKVGMRKVVYQVCAGVMGTFNQGAVRHTQGCMQAGACRVMGAL